MASFYLAFPAWRSSFGGPAVLDQTLALGAKTLAGDGGVAPINNGGTSTSASIDDGDPSGHLQIAADGTITPTVTGEGILSGPYSLDCTFTNASGSDTARITVAIDANTYSVSADDTGNEVEFIAALDDMGLAGGATIKFRSGRHLATDTDTGGVEPTGAERQDWTAGRSYTSPVTITSHDPDDWVVVVGQRLNGAPIGLRDATNITFTQIDFLHEWVDGYHLAGMSNNNRPGLRILGAPEGLVFDDVIMRGDITEIGGDGFWVLTFIDSPVVANAVTVRDSEFKQSARAVSSSCNNTFFENNLFRDFSWSFMVRGNGISHTVRYCDMHSPSADPASGGHLDFLQYTLGTGQGEQNDVIEEGCRLLTARSDGRDFKDNVQALFSNSTDTLMFRDWRVRAILVFGKNSMGVSIVNAVGARINQCTLVAPVGTASNVGPQIRVYVGPSGSDEALSGNEAYDNFCRDVSVDILDVNNVENVAANYDTIFDNPGVDPVTIPEMETNFQPLAGGPLTTPVHGVGALGFSFIDSDGLAPTIGRAPSFDIPRLNTPTLADIPDLTGQSTSTTVQSAWGEISAVVNNEGDPASNGVLVAVDGGDYRIADDDQGTNATAFGTADTIVAAGKFIQYQTVTSASAATAVTVTVNVGSVEDIWTATTA